MCLTSSVSRLMSSDIRLLLFRVYISAFDQSSMNFDKFDEFGNPIDGDGHESDSGSDVVEEVPEPQSPLESAIVLPENKMYYPTPEQTFPRHTKVKNEMQDRQDYNTPVLNEEKKRKIAADLASPPKTNFTTEFLVGLLSNMNSIRNLAFVGQLSSGKTEFIDSLVRETHPGIVESMVTRKDITNRVMGDGYRFDRLCFTDRLLLEKRKKMTIQSKLVTLVDSAIDGKSLALNIIDTPGHPDFMDQVISGIALADGVAFCVDLAEGLSSVGKRLLEAIVGANLKLILVLTKIDRLILEMKLPPNFAEMKTQKIVEDFNTTLEQLGYKYGRVSPELGNVVFSSAQFSLCFTLESIGRQYFKDSTSAEEMAGRLWGDYRRVTFTESVGDIERRSFKITPSTSQDSESTFILYVLNPIYKIITQVVSLEPKAWSKNLGIHLSHAEESLNLAPLLRIAFSRVYGPFSPFISVICKCLPSPEVLSESSADVIAQATKFIPSSDGKSTSALVRIWKGFIKPGMQLFAMSEKFKDDSTAFFEYTTSDIFLSHCRYSTQISQAGPGMIICMNGLKEICTLSDVKELQLAPLQIPPSYARVAIEPFNPLKAGEMITSIGLAKLCYPSLDVKIEATGEYNLFAPGELYFDCVLYDIRNSFADIEVKVSDPFVAFTETVAEKSVTICRVNLDDHTRIGITAEPMGAPLQYDLETGRFKHTTDPKPVLETLGWDALSANNFLCFGPDDFVGPNALIEDVLPPKPEYPPGFVANLKRSFLWATKQGPLCDEMIRGVVFRLAQFTNDGVNEQIPPVKAIPQIRKALFASVLAAAPKLMEPLDFVEVITSTQATQIVMEIIEKRRGKILKKRAIQGTPLHSITAEVPLIDAFGMEVEIRSRTVGQAFPQMFFNRWSLVPGSPMDSSIVLRPLEISADACLAREFAVKSRRRKGLPDDIDLSNYCDDNLLIEIAQLSGSG